MSVFGPVGQSIRASDAPDNTATKLAPFAVIAELCVVCPPLIAPVSAIAAGAAFAAVRKRLRTRSS